MRLSRAVLGGTTLALLLAGVSTAHAGPIPWTYNWSRSPSQVHADAPGTGYISLTDEKLVPTAGDSDIVATNIQTHSTATPQNPDVFTNAAYTVSLLITDGDSGKTGTLTFHGVLNGTISKHQSNIRNTFVGATEQMVVIGNHLYKVGNWSYTQPGPPDSANSGTISAHAEVTVQTLPEPGTLVLSGGGIVLLILGGRARRRRARKGDAAGPDEPGARL
jgi:hypothetical protein